MHCEAGRTTQLCKVCSCLYARCGIVKVLLWSHTPSSCRTRRSRFISLTTKFLQISKRSSVSQRRPASIRASTLTVRIDTLWQQRRDTLDKLFEPISTILREATRLHRMSGARCDRQCPATARYLQYLADKFAMAGLWPEPWDRDKRVVDVLEAMRTVDISEVEFILWPGVQRCASCDLDLRGEAINGLKRRLRDAADRVEDEIRGLCYECLRSGMLGSGACEHRKGEQMEVAGRQ